MNILKFSVEVPKRNDHNSKSIDILESVNKSDNTTSDRVTPSFRFLKFCFIVLVIAWIYSYYTDPPTNELFVKTISKISAETKIEHLDNNIFPSGDWTSSYFQYHRSHGPYTFSLMFDHQELKVTGSGKDDVGVFSIDGIYSLNTRRIGLTKTYQKGTGNSLENLGHTVTIQLEWNFQKYQFEGKWYVSTHKYRGSDEFTLKFDQ